MSSPWAEISIPEPISLQEIMLQEAEKELQVKQNIKRAQSNSVATNKTQACDVSQECCDQVDAEDALAPNSDAFTARLLQQQFHEEYNTLKHIEDKSNGTLKMPASFDDRLRALQNLDFEGKSSEEEKIEDFHDTKDLDLSEAANNAITKHDITFHTKDKVQNRLKLHQIQNQATVDLIVKEYKMSLCWKINSKKRLTDAKCIIGIGKTPESARAYRNMSKKSAIKVFTFTDCEVNRREQHSILENEHLIGRTTYYFSITENKPFKTNFHLSAKKEIPCPKVVASKPYLLIMDLIGSNYCYQQILCNAILTDDEYISAYNQVVDLLKLLYCKAGLIVTYLFQYNIHWHKKHCYFVNPTLVPICHDGGFNYLMADCKNVVDFFTNKGVPSVKEPHDLFMEITGFHYDNKVAMEDAINTLKMKPHDGYRISRLIFHPCEHSG